MSEPFGTAYSEAYDLLYRDKDYQAECDLIQRIFESFGQKTIRSVLDLGCGTGGHAIPLARKGYEVTGVDRSEAMLKRAREKSNTSDGSTIDFQLGDIRELKLRKQFDSALVMFAVLGYQLTNVDVTATLNSIRRHLAAGSLMVFDVWYGPAVLRVGPSERFKVIPTSDAQVLRLAKGKLVTREHVCTIDYHLWWLRENMVTESTETHTMRYFFPLELELLLQNSGFRLLRLGSFPEFDSDPTDSTWNVLAVAEVV
jgi:SAM-dependent methyltransferase